jgi:hypothetical protein
MRLYTDEEEERIRAQQMVREWTRSGLLNAAQGTRLAGDLRVDLRRTNPFLRGGLALFTGVIVAASVALILTFFDVSHEVSISVITGIAALACIGLAEYLVYALRCYRFGVEEALAASAVVLLGISGGALTSGLHVGGRAVPTVVALLIGTAGGLGLYGRFGFVYAALGSIVCAAAIPFQLDLPERMRRVLAAAAIASFFVVARSKRLKHRDDYPGGDYGLLQAAAWAGIYLVLNLQLPSGWYGLHGLFYWCTYALTWVLPLTGFRLGIREKDRELMDVSLALALVTMVTNRPYLGWPRHTWDPIVLGVVLIAIAIAIRRWLSNGPGGARNGFTAAQILDQDGAALSMVGTASVIARSGIASGAAPSPAAPAASEFRGGRSGGGGGGGSF